MLLNYYAYDLNFRHPFKIAAGSRNSTPIVIVELIHGDYTGYGEAALPPYLPETRESVMAFLSEVNTTSFSFPPDPESAIAYVNNIAEGNYCAKAAMDMAIYDLFGKFNKQPVFRLWVKGDYQMPQNTYTLGMDKPEVMIKKIQEAENFNLLKIKLGGPYDNLIVKTVRENTDKPLCVDANQGWEDEYFALDMINWLAEENVIFIEQPLPKTSVKQYAWLKAKSPLPIIGDESIQGIDDLNKANDLFHGINIKLMKCGGIASGYKMVKKAKEMKLKILIGCMSESSCGVSAAAQLAPFADWTDLDGPLLITNDPFDGITYRDGRIVFADTHGIGVIKKPGAY